VTYDKEKSVEFKMMFRHHMDPLYYDTKANSKIFVPQVGEGHANEAQKSIIDSFPAEDRGEILDAEEYSKKGYGHEQKNFISGTGADMVSLIETDQFEAAAKKHRLRADAQQKKAEKRKREKGGDLDFISENEDENPYDSEEKEYQEDEKSNASYDSELEAEFFGKKDPEKNIAENNRREPEQIDSSKKGGFSQDDFKDQIEDVNRTLKQFKVMKPADGVEFVQYDQYGLPIKDGDKDGLRAVLAADDGDDKGFEYVAPTGE